MNLAPLFQRAATRLSWLGQLFPLPRAWFRGLARLSLGAAAVSMLSGCLVDDPPPYIAPQRTPPRLDYSKATPGLDQLIVKNSGELIEFKIPVASEDAGDPLAANLLLDYGGDGTMADFLRPGTMPASTLSDPNPRVFSLPWTVRPALAPGCHRFTLRVTHASNVDLDRPELAIDKSDLAEAFWFANINVAPENAGSLVNCPTGGVK